MIHVLLVDDHTIIREGLKSVLHPQTDHIQVVGEAASGQAAIAFLESATASAAPPVDVVVMDINMPGVGAKTPINGLEATRYIRERFPQVKVLLLTMLDQQQLIQQASQAGAQGYVLKVAGHKEIIHAIRTVYEGEEYFSSQVTRILLGGLNPPTGRVAENGPGPSPDQSTRAGQAAVPPEPPYPLPAGISPRELEVLGLIAQGFTTNEISEKLFTGKRTIETHRQNLLTKTQSSNTAALIRFAVQQGLV